MSRSLSRRQLFKLAGAAAGAAALPSARTVLPAASVFGRTGAVVIQLGYNDWGGHHSDAIHYAMESFREWSTTLAALQKDNCSPH
jgi:hypothetical protein